MAAYPRIKTASNIMDLVAKNDIAVFAALQSQVPPSTSPIRLHDSLVQRYFAGKVPGRVDNVVSGI